MSLSRIVVFLGPEAELVVARLTSASGAGGQVFEAPYGDRTLPASQLTLFRPEGAQGLTLVAVPEHMPASTRRAALARAEAVVLLPTEGDPIAALHADLRAMATRHPLVALVGSPDHRAALSHPDPGALLDIIADQLLAGGDTREHALHDAEGAEEMVAPGHSPPPPAPMVAAPSPAMRAAPKRARRGAPTSMLGRGDGAPRALDEAHDAPMGPLERRSTVRYYRRMNPRKNYPVLVAFTREALAKAKGVAQVEGAGLVLDAARPVITVVPVFPGCLCSPNQIEVDLTPESVEVRFWLTPLVNGRLGDARVEIHQDGRCLDRIPTPAVVADQTITRLTAAGSALSPVAGKLLEKIGLDPITWVSAQLPTVGAWISRNPQALQWGAAGALALLAAALYAARRARMAPLVDHRFVLAGA